MRKPVLHFVGVSPAIQTAVEAAFYVAIARYPNVDSATIAIKAEQLARYMEENKDGYNSVRRYAYSAMLGKVRDLRNVHEVSVGLSAELEEYAGVQNSFQPEIDRSILIEQVRAQLSDRDRHILVLLLQDGIKTEDIAQKLGITHAAARKAVERARERMAHCIAASSPRRGLAEKASPQTASNVLGQVKECT
jgi:RNA polymerase sigma factor (sigma-70 family)